MSYIDVIIAVVFIGVLLYLYKIGKTELVKRMVLALVVQAEKTYGSGTGELKYAMVVKEFYEKLPIILRTLFTEKELNDMIEVAVEKLKHKLKYGTNLNGHTEEFFLRQ